MATPAQQLPAPSEEQPKKPRIFKKRYKFKCQSCGEIHYSAFPDTKWCQTPGRACYQAAKRQRLKKEAEQRKILDAAAAEKKRIQDERDRLDDLAEQHERESYEAEKQPRAAPTKQLAAQKSPKRSVVAPCSHCGGEVWALDPVGIINRRPKMHCIRCRHVVDAPVPPISCPHCHAGKDGWRLDCDGTLTHLEYPICGNQLDLAHYKWRLNSGL
jgi:hypothetical protein